jgi:hypothetical protein
MSAALLIALAAQVGFIGAWLSERWTSRVKVSRWMD